MVLVLEPHHPRLAATIPFCVAGVGMLFGMPGAIYWLAPGFVFSFIAGGVSAWVLLVEILR